MKMMRIFTGIALSDEVREKILKESKPFRKAGTPMRWTAAENVHLTLKFIGEVDEPLAGRVAEALPRPPALPPFVLRARGFGKFPAGDELHVLWAGVEASQPLQSLYAGVEAALEPLGISRDSRPFHPHITLGRNKVRYNFKGLLALLEGKTDLFFGEWRVAAYRLFSSRLLPAGPVYTVLKEIALVQS
jgi:2'-5' RNA ligase